MKPKRIKYLSFFAFLLIGGLFALYSALGQPVGQGSITVTVPANDSVSADITVNGTSNSSPLQSNHLSLIVQSQSQTCSGNPTVSGYYGYSHNSQTGNWDNTALVYPNNFLIIGGNNFGANNAATISGIPGASLSASVATQINVSLGSAVGSYTATIGNGNSACTSTSTNVAISSADALCGGDNGANLYSAPTYLCNSSRPFYASAVTITGGTNPGWTWSCNSLYGGSPASCSANKKVDGVCGTASKIYNSGGGWGSDTFCQSAGMTPTPTSPTFPSMGGSVTWTCGGINGGATNSSCGASRPASFVCPSSGNAVILSANPILVGQQSTASAPAGYSGGSFSSSNTAVATVSGVSNSIVTGKAVGTSVIAGTGWSYSNGAINCALTGTTLTVNGSCVALTYKPATSGFSLSPSGPAQATLSVDPSSVFYAFVDYGQANIDSIQAPNIGGGSVCTFDNAWLGTAARFLCLSPASSGTYTYSTGLNSGTSSNTCAASHTVGNTNGLTVVNAVVDGSCATPPNGSSFYSAPTGILCSRGTASPSSLSGNGPWSWQCVGSGGGITASCSASVSVGYSCVSNDSGAPICQQVSSNPQYQSSDCNLSCPQHTYSCDTGNYTCSQDDVNGSYGSQAGCNAACVPTPTCDATPGNNYMKGCVFNGGSSFGSYVGPTSGSPVASGNADNFAGLPDYNVGANGGNHTASKTQHFSVRWLGKFTFSGGSYVFTAGSDDGKKVWVCDQNGNNCGSPVINDWINQGYTGSIKNSAPVSLSAGDHVLKMEYYQDTGWAEYSLSWTQVAGMNCSSLSAGSNQMTGLLFNNKNLTAPSYAAAPAGALASGNADTFTAIDDNWGNGGPSSLVDNFSTCWKGSFTLSAGTYQFTAGSDDGNRLYIDDLNNPVINVWSDRSYSTSPSPHTVTFNSTTQHTIRYDFYENGGAAQAYLKWVKTASAGPEISLNPATMTFTGVSGQPAPAPQTVTLSNLTSGTTLRWKATVDPGAQGWCNISKTSGTTPYGSPDNLIITMGDPSQIGSFTCDITFSDHGSSPAAINSPQHLLITYNVASCTSLITTVPSSGSPANSSPGSYTANWGTAFGPASAVSALRFRAGPLANQSEVDAGCPGYPGGNCVVAASLPKSATSYSVPDASNGKTLAPSTTYYNRVAALCATYNTDNTGLYPNYVQYTWNTAVSNTCTALTYHPATSGFSLSPSGPINNTLTITPGQEFYAFVDYGNSGTGAIIPAYTSGTPVYSCVWNGSSGWVGTSARFDCLSNTSPPGSPSTPGQYNFFSGTNTTGNTCASGPDNVGTVTVSSGTTPPGGGGDCNSQNTCPYGSGHPVCDYVRLQWVDKSNNENGFYVYRSPQANPGDSNFNDAVKVADITSTTIAGSDQSYSTDYSPPDNSSYYYWVTAYISSGNQSAPLALSSIASYACVPDLYGSDKEILAVNNTAVSPVPEACGQSTPLPSYETVKTGDVMTFSVNICNDNGSAPVKGLQVIDYLTSLQIPSGPNGWNMWYTPTYGSTAGGTQIIAGSGSGTYSVSGTSPNQVITINLTGNAFNIPAHGHAYLMLDGQIQPASQSGSGTRLFRNAAHINYTGSPGEDVGLPYQPFLNGNNAPIIQERP